MLVCIHRRCCIHEQQRVSAAQVFDGDMAYLHQTGVITKTQDASLDSWARDYFLASEADKYAHPCELYPLRRQAANSVLAGCLCC